MNRTLDYERVLEMMLRENQITLFNIDGSERVLNLDRHVDDYASYCATEGTYDWRSIVLQLTFDLWAIWEVHIRNSFYWRPHYSCVHIEERWLKEGMGAPPCVLVRNVDFRTLDERPSIPPFSYRWSSTADIGDIECYSLVLQESGKCYRFYLK